MKLLFGMFPIGIPQDKKTAADMYEKAALLGERGAEEQAKRLRRETKRLGKSDTSVLDRKLITLPFFQHAAKSLLNLQYTKM